MYCASLWDSTIAASLTLGFGFLQQVFPSCINIKAQLRVELYVWLFPIIIGNDAWPHLSMLGNCRPNLKTLCNFLYLANLCKAVYLLWLSLFVPHSGDGFSETVFLVESVICSQTLVIVSTILPAG
ncbi:hypothetical protein Pelo_6732 [Pelomyxa schiedti]|nr:hypothetical protein Pelo_6732 [Pelomyxa schiedti]